MPDASYLHSALAVVSTPRTALLLALLVMATIVDVRSYRIPNALTVAGMLAGLAASTLAATTPWTGFLNGAAGLFAALLLMVPLHALRVIGGGDVKLAAACGAFLGWPDILPALFFVVVAGGLMALAWTVLGGSTARTAANVVRIARSLSAAAWVRSAPVPPTLAFTGRLPYAACMLAGIAAFLVVRQAW